MGFDDADKEILWLDLEARAEIKQSNVGPGRRQSCGPDQSANKKRVTTLNDNEPPKAAKPSPFSNVPQ
jgi:hypothetical protein